MRGKGSRFPMALLVVFLLLLGSAQAEPPVPYMVKDIDSGGIGSDPSSLVEQTTTLTATAPPLAAARVSQLRAKTQP